jgi:hypothetical protein
MIWRILTGGRPMSRGDWVLWIVGILVMLAFFVAFADLPVPSAIFICLGWVVVLYLGNRHEIRKARDKEK